MIPIHKDLKTVPESLKVDEDSIAHNPTRTTYERRNKLIARGGLPSIRSTVYSVR